LVFGVTDGFSNVDVGKVVDTDLGIFFLHLFSNLKILFLSAFYFHFSKEMKKK
jgi:hypothetical protein